MKEKDCISTSSSWPIFLIGIILILSSLLVTQWQPISTILLALGCVLSGYLPIQTVQYHIRGLMNRREVESTYRDFSCKVKRVNRKKDLPIFIAVDIEGCITPPDRTEIDLRKFQRLRCYCEYVKEERKFPPLVVCTGRSQGYVESLAQSLGMVDRGNIDLPFVIENGSAIYYPVSKKTRRLISNDQMKLIQEIHIVLTDNLIENEFEPKVYMITINPATGEKIGELKDKVVSIIRDYGKEEDVYGKLKIEHTASAVDITPAGIDKISGLEKTLECYHQLRPESGDKGFEHVVAIADSTSDLCVITEVGNAYCSVRDGHTEVKNCILQSEKFNDENIIALDQIDFVMEAIERETDLQII